MEAAYFKQADRSKKCDILGNKVRESCSEGNRNGTALRRSVVRLGATSIVFESRP